MTKEITIPHVRDNRMAFLLFRKNVLNTPSRDPGILPVGGKGADISDFNSSISASN